MNRRLLSLLSVVAALLAACGGGSSATSSNPGGGGNPGGGSALQLTRGAITTRDATSITVNGVHLEVEHATVRVEKEDRPHTDLQRGMVVSVRGTFDDRSGSAAEVEFEDALRGAVDDKGTDFISVGGQIVRVDDSTEWSGSGLGAMSAGHRVRVSGVSDRNGEIRASRVDDDSSASGEFELKGFVSSLSATGFDLAVSPDATVKWSVVLGSGASIPAGVANGSFVEVRSASRPQGNVITASSISLDDRHESEASDVELEGIVTSGTSDDFVVDGQAVHTTASTRWILGAPADLVPGVKVEVEGHSMVAGVLQAEKVAFRAVDRLQGPVSAVAVSGTVTTFQVVGVSVSMPSETVDSRLSGALANGMIVEVRGYPNSAGTGMVATRIESTNDTRLVLQGTVSAMDAAAGNVTILGLTGASTSSTEYHPHNDPAQLDRATFFSQVTPGTTVVKVRGRDASALSGSTLSAKEMELEDHE